MKATKCAVALLTAIGISAIALPAMAYEAGDILVRGRVLEVNPQDDSGEVSINGTKIPGSGVTVNNDVIPELDFTYMINSHWGVELILGYSEHDVDASGSLNAVGQVIEAKVLPPTLTLQYHLDTVGGFSPYVGAGVNYTYYFDESVEGILNVPGAKVKMDDSWGLAVQAGFDYALNDDWFLNMDIKYIQIDTTAKFKGTAVGNVEVDVDIDPLVYGVGIGRRF